MDYKQQGREIQRIGAAGEKLADAAIRRYEEIYPLHIQPNNPKIKKVGNQWYPDGPGAPDRQIHLGVCSIAPQGAYLLFDVKQAKKPVQDTLNRGHQCEQMKKVLAAWANVPIAVCAGYLVRWYFGGNKRREPFSEWRWHDAALLDVFIVETKKKDKRRKIGYRIVLEKKVKLYREDGFLIGRMFEPSMFWDIPSVPDFLEAVVKANYSHIIRRYEQFSYRVVANNEKLNKTDKAELDRLSVMARKVTHSELARGHYDDEKIPVSVVEKRASDYLREKGVL